MRTLFFILLVHTCNYSHGQTEAGLEQYTYMGAGQDYTVAPVIHYQGKNKWYTEARYNYEDQQTFSLYAGKTFSGGEKQIAWSFTPMIGGMTGKLQGGLAALNMDIHFKQFYFSAQSQYGVGSESRNNNFFFSWSEAGYQPLEWFYTGISVQHTKLYGCDALSEAGILVGFCFKQWSFPVYSFNAFGNQPYFVLGINRAWTFAKRKRNSTIASSQVNSNADVP